MEEYLESNRYLVAELPVLLYKTLNLVVHLYKVLHRYLLEYKALHHHLDLGVQVLDLVEQSQYLSEDQTVDSCSLQDQTVVQYPL